MNKHEIFTENILSVKKTDYENTFNKYINRVDYESDTNIKVNENIEKYCDESEYFGSLQYLYDEEGKCNFIIDLLLKRQDHLGLFNVLKLKDGWKSMPDEIVYFHCRQLCKNKVNKNEMKKILSQQKKINKKVECPDPTQTKIKEGIFTLRF